MMFAVATLAFLASLVGTDQMRRYAGKVGLLDIPNHRSSHQVPTPRGGGIAIVFVFLGSILGLAAARQLAWTTALAFVAGGGLVGLVGYLDDRRPMPATVRLSVHCVAAISIVAVLGPLPDWTLANWGLSGALVAWAISLLMLVWSTNLFNFMDGIDGLAGSEALFVSGAAAALCWQQGERGGYIAALLCLAAVSLGFLHWNWPPAKIFMGDVGSGFLGFVIALFALCICQRGSLPWETWVILTGVFFVDATVTLIRRMLRGDRWMQAHRAHAYQHAARRLQGHLPVTVAAAMINLFWLAPWAWAATVAPAHAKFCMGCALVPLCILALVIGAGRDDASH